jgi:hypothetical protein
MLVEQDGYRSEDCEVVWWHRERFRYRLIRIYICTEFVKKVVYVSCRRQTSLSGFVALSVMFVMGLHSLTLAQRKPDSAKTL